MKQQSDIILPIAKPVFCDFPNYERTGFKMLENGKIETIPFVSAAKIDPPCNFPAIPIFDSRVQEAADGLYEVSNVLEALNPSPKVENMYKKLLENMESKFTRSFFGRHQQQQEEEGEGEEEEGDLIIQICEDTAYQIEALIGYVQICEDSTAFQIETLYALGVERIGLLYTYKSLSFDQNYNLNLLMTNWLKSNWDYPFLSDETVLFIATKFGFEYSAIHTWIKNARTMVWGPLQKIIF